MKPTLISTITLRYGNVIYYVYNLDTLLVYGFGRNNWIPSVFTFCVFCKGYRWHSFIQRSREEYSICDSCRNVTTDRLLTIEAR
jgi:hypothetical protein